MLSISNSLLAMTALFNVGIAIFIFRGNWRNPVNVFFCSFLIALASWAIILIEFQLSQTSSAAIVFGKAAYAAASWVAVSFYLFSFSFPESLWPHKFRIAYGIFITILFWIALSIPGFLIKDITITASGKNVQENVSDYLIFCLIFIVFYVGGLVQVWIKYLRATGITRLQLLAIALCVTITGLGGMYYNLLLASPFIGDFRFLWTGPLFTTSIGVIVMYSVFRFRLFNAKVIATELLIGLLWIFTFLRTLLAASTQEQFFNGGLFALSLIIGSLLVKSVRDEVRAREEVEELSQQKSEFMSFASHEIRNPITTMRGFASLISDGTVGQVSAQVQDVAQKILVNGDAVLLIISEFLNKSKLELGQISYTLVDVDIERTVRSVVEGFRSHARENNLTLDTKIDFQGLTAKADEPKLREVVGNLIDNSMKYTKQGGVTVTVEKRNGMARIIVSDTGVGIPQETLPNLFQKFSRADAQKLNLRGTGLGLYLAKTFIEGMGGKIWAESDGKDKGSRFIIELHAV